MNSQFDDDRAERSKSEQRIVNSREAKEALDAAFRNPGPWESACESRTTTSSSALEEDIAEALFALKHGSDENWRQHQDYTTAMQQARVAIAAIRSAGVPVAEHGIEPLYMMAELANELRERSKWLSDRSRIADAILMQRSEKIILSLLSKGSRGN